MGARPASAVTSAQPQASHTVGVRGELNSSSRASRSLPRHPPGHSLGHLAKSSRSRSACPALGSLGACQPRPLAAPQPNPMPAAGRATPRLWPPLADVARQRSRREGRKQLKQSSTKPGGRAAPSSGKAVPRPAGSGVPSQAGCPPARGHRSAHLSCLVWLTMDRTFSSPSIFGLPNSSSFTCYERQGRPLAPGQSCAHRHVGRKGRWPRTQGTSPTEAEGHAPSGSWWY